MYSTTTLTILSLLVSPSLASVIGRTPDPANAGGVKIPLNIHDKRQYSNVLEERQDWLLSQAKGLRSKYASQLNEEGKRLLERDLREESLRKRASGSVTCMFFFLLVSMLIQDLQMSVQTRVIPVKSV